MKSRFLFVSFFLLIFVFVCAELFASGRKQEPDLVTVNTEWTLCITAPDVSGLSPARQITGDTVSRNLIRELQGLNFRLRGDEEVFYYRDYAWMTARAAAAKALAAKRSERDLLIYRGDRPWRYRKNLKVIDDAILKLEEDLAKVDDFAPSVEGRPLFKLVDANLNGNFPRPPEEGEEYRFCTTQKADAFIASSLLEYHDRLYLTVRLYTLYSRSFSFEDSVLFSSDDIAGALEEITNRLAAAISAIQLTGILVHVTPDDSMVIIDGSYVARDEKLTFLPGTVEVTVRADNYVPVSVPVELKSGELSELFISLTPMGLSAFDINVPGKPGSRVFLGSRYVGETPLALDLPRQEYGYISVETPDGEIGSMIYRDHDFIRGNAQFTWADNRGRADIFAKPPRSAEEKRVEKARRGFYIAYGAFWVILPASLLTAGYARTNVEANLNVGRNTGIYYGAQAVWGTSLAVTISQIVRYLYVSGEDARPIVRVPEKEASR